MKRSEMVCRTCIKAVPWRTEITREIHPGFVACRENATALHEGWAMEVEAWCARGEWHKWSERYKEMESYYWGEWEEKEEQCLKNP